MKKGFISFLIMTLMITSISLANISSVQAATTDNAVTTTDNTIKVSLENIRDIMIENNLDIKIQHDALEIVQQEYHDARDAYDAYDGEPTVSEEPTDKTDPDYETKKEQYDKEVATLKAYNTAKTTYETKLDDYKIAKTAYDKAVEAKVIAAQGAYINYLSNLSDAKLKDDAVKSNEKEEQVYKLQYESGFISKNKYTSLLQNNTTPVNELKQLKDNEELARIKLCNTLGISPEENITFNTDITQDFEVIAKIDYNTDLEKMLENNIEIKDKNDEIDDLKDAEDDYDNQDIYDYKVEKANNELKLLMNDAETSFKEQYNTLMNSYNSIKSSYDSINQEKNTYSIMQTKYDYGFVSQKEVNDEKLTLDTNESALQAKKNTLYVNYLNYLQTKEGY